MNPQPSPDFAYLAHHDARLVALATKAEQHLAADPTVTLFKLRQFAKVLARRTAAKGGLYVDPQEAQQRLIDRLTDGGAIGATQRAIRHDVRRVGSAAVHEGIRELADLKHLEHLSDSVIEEYEESALV